ncbi:MAG: hypothetical protein HYV63_02050 [Candidatus Schekmanbacteria bacterium]|nr:hypothetical protein [Candidatus Schekmanbacteria bacterium]
MARISRLGIAYDPENPDVQEIMAQIQVAVGAKRRRNDALAALAPGSDAGDAAASETAPRDELWKSHDGLKKHFAMGLEAGGRELMFKHVALMNYRYDVRPPAPPELIDISLPPRETTVRGRLAGKVRNAVFRWLERPLRQIVERLTALDEAVFRQVQFNAEAVRLANDLKVKIESQRRFNEHTTQFAQDVIFRLHDHAMEINNRVIEIRDRAREIVALEEKADILQRQQDTLFALGNMAQVVEEHLLLVRAELAALRQTPDGGAPQHPPSA